MSEVGSFWARRRAAVRAEEEAEARAAEIALSQADADALAEKDDAEVLEELGLPDPATLQAGDDFSAFMSPKVPERLRKVALRALWRSNPVLANLDGLNEYDDDYRAAMLLQEPIKTAYQVGKGMMKHIEEMERKAEAAEIAKDAEAEEGEPKEQAVLAEASDSEPEEQLAQPTVESAFMDAGDDAVASDPAPRRMQFRFEEAAV
jgi:hypothetical protein